MFENELIFVLRALRMIKWSSLRMWEDLSFTLRKLQEEYICTRIQIHFDETDNYNMFKTGKEVQNQQVADGQEVKRTRKIKYLGYMLTKHRTREEEINRLQQTSVCTGQPSFTLRYEHYKTYQRLIFSAVVGCIKTYGTKQMCIRDRLQC